MTIAMALSELLHSARADDRVVALRGDLPLRWRTLRSSVFATLAALEGKPGGHWVLYDSDSFRFAVGLLALLHSGRTPLLPGNAQPGTLQELAPQVQGFLGEPHGVDAIAIRESAIADDTLLAPIGTDATLELMTSGSSGDAKRVVKQLAQLDAELQCHLQSWRDRLDDDTLFVASVSHQHIYGLLFRLLLPLLRGAPFATETFEYNEPLYAAVAGSRKAVVVTSPAHLSRLPPALDGTAVQSRLALLLSSGGPLPAAAAQQAQTLFGQSPLEIFGSTETGGIASRRQPEQRHWQPLPGVAIDSDSDGLLVVRSAWADDQHQHTADRVDIHADGRFTLLGRADTIVKVEEKRLSLDAMNRRLQQHPWVAQARVLLLSDRQRLGAVIALSDAGRTQLTQRERSALIAALRDHLGQFFERTLLPRKWRLLDALPQDSQGKVTLRALQMLFAQAASPQSQQSQQSQKGAPGELLTKDENSCEIAIDLLRHTAAFDGHFPGLPVLPGVYQLDWAIRHARRWLLTEALRFVAVDQLKFSEAVSPGLPLLLRLQRQGERVEFSYRCGALPLSSGRIQFANAAATLANAAATPGAAS